MARKLMDILELSFKKLPSSLKSCFLYVGSFDGECEILVRRLMKLWIAEGFIQCTAEKRLEEVSEEYLMNLVNRSFVMAAKKRPDGGMKSCCVHDTLKDLCRLKSKENRFLHLICQCEHKASHYHTSFLIANVQFYSFYSVYDTEVHIERKIRVFTLLKTLDLLQMCLDVFLENKMEKLHNLSCLAIRVYSIESLPSSIFNLWRLTTFILNVDVRKGGRIALTNLIFSMARLRNFQVSTMQIIEVYRSAASTEESVGKIQESQRDIGNEDLKVFIYPQLQA